MPRLLATQSHVVHGYVGNKAGTFPLQCAGWDVDCVNSVQYSNHTGYGMDKVFGSRTSANELQEVFRGVQRMESEYDAILSGYMPDRDSLVSMALFYEDLKKRNKKRDPRILWLLDPVMGDEGQLYVDAEVVPEYRRIVRSGAVDIVTPNQYELELLCGWKIENLDGLIRAIEEVGRDVNVVVVTSCNGELFGDTGHIYCVASMRGAGAKKVYRVPVIDSYFTGVGDLFSSWLLHRIHGMIVDGRKNFGEEVNVVLNVLQEVLENTRERCGKEVGGVMGDAAGMRGMELRVVESVESFEREEVKRDFLFCEL